MLNFNKYLNYYFQELSKSVLNSKKKNLEKAIDLIIDKIKKKRTIFVCGNGGSASDSSHFTAEMIGRFTKNKIPLPFITLNSEISTITAISNDFSYNKIFSLQLKALAKPGDLLFCISTSGKSKNIINVIRTAKKLNLYSVLLTSQKYREEKEICDCVIKVQSVVTSHIQEIHIIVIHILSTFIENHFAN